MFLQPTDVDRGNVRLERPVVDGGESAFADEAGLACRNTPPRRSTLVPMERGLRYLTAAEDLVVTDQWVARYRPADAAQYLNQVRTAVADCSPYPNASVTTVARFAGQDSLLVRIEIRAGGPAIQSDPVDYVFVRQGDLVTEFEWAGTNDAAEQVGRRAAARLCAGTPTC
ncbi:hypothetical protein [Rugosimonospora africana]|uniref:PknH-like extracellular domain-containing protein n=1 Tax=Rugosimonospora africana TaxID=556532 RepID=A0A8J3QRM8_9ACTN|nr:hypothetical protein [Rugosimonospora africana]GIH15271.1 hypothetical protein Raf01_34430 [Rugosimonospora africana]